MKYEKIPASTQVIVAHGPPFRAGDRTSRGDRAGSPALMDRILQLPELRLVVTGHIHEDWGAHAIGEVGVLNVSYVDEWYEPAHEPLMLDWPPVTLTIEVPTLDNARPSG
jgi:Icc-related predicted phosphoesterase